MDGGEMKRLLLTAAIGGVPYLPLGPALSIATIFDSAISIQLYHPRTDHHVIDPMSWGLTSYASPQGVLRKEIDLARQAISARLTELGLNDHATRFSVEDRPLSSWRELSFVSRVHDLSIVSREALVDCGPTAMEQLLFDSGRPMLLSPHDWSQPIGDYVAIAWNRSSETARLVSQTMEVLRQAREVHVIEIEDWFVDGPPGKGICDYLKANGVAAQLHSTGKARAEFGYQILHEAQIIGADLLLKGAYTQSRISQVMFGGATRDILREARLPVLLAH
jgi:nucleotide-binding universal stress UspA family protein